MAWRSNEYIAERARQHLDAGADHVRIQVLRKTGEPPAEAWRALADAVLQSKGPMSAPRGDIGESDNGEQTDHSETPIDYRFTLANERTYLSWIRTALGLLAGGVAAHTMVVEHWETEIRAILAIS
ncbi:DUF202 domain-containing protein [Nocardia sp. CA-290969]|uniref:YidH family protein n=1 Tax=Nocardia sp. CA-290969 TaxID=3239986 RepID=UPI003D92B80B